MSTPEAPKIPSKLWWIGHIFFGIITGLICYILWKDENPKAAKKHLIHSIWLGFVAYIPFFVFITFLSVIELPGTI